MANILPRSRAYKCLGLATVLSNLLDRSSSTRQTLRTFPVLAWRRRVKDATSTRLLDLVRCCPSVRQLGLSRPNFLTQALTPSLELLPHTRNGTKLLRRIR